MQVGAANVDDICVQGFLCRRRRQRVPDAARDKIFLCLRQYFFYGPGLDRGWARFLPPNSKNTERKATDRAFGHITFRASGSLS